MIHLPVWAEAAVFVPLAGLAAWQERKELRRLFLELWTWKRIESENESER